MEYTCTTIKKYYSEILPQKIREDKKRAIAIGDLISAMIKVFEIEIIHEKKHGNGILRTHQQKFFHTKDIDTAIEIIKELKKARAEFNKSLKPKKDK